METEIWKDVPWWEWLYAVSNFWRVVSYKKWISILRLYPTSQVPYLKVYFYKRWNNSLWKAKWYLVHRLVASAFLWLDLNSFNNPKTSLCVCHKDDNPSNNRVDNLFLWTSKENNHDMWKKNRWVRMHWWDNHMSRQVFQYTYEWTFIKKWDSISTAANSLWTNVSNICAVCKGRRKLCAWYIWKYDF